MATVKVKAARGGPAARKAQPKKTQGSSGVAKAVAEAVKRSRRLGKPINLIVTVNPRRQPTIRLMTAASPDKLKPAPGDGGGELEAALAAARERGRARVADILDGTEMLSAEQFATLIGTSRVTVNAKRQNRQVLGLEGAKRGFRYPEWQIDEDGKPFDVLPALFVRLGGRPWTVYRFLVQHHSELDGLTGREALHRGLKAEVLETAESVLRAAG